MKELHLFSRIHFFCKDAERTTPRANPFSLKIIYCRGLQAYLRRSTPLLLNTATFVKNYFEDEIAGIRTEKHT
jgi:hypothetical protein